MNKGNAILLVICLITIAAGTAIFFEASSFQKTAKITVGTVDASDNTFFYVKYLSDDGKEWTHRGSQAKNKKHRAGEKFTVFYQIENPEKSRINDGVKTGRNIIVIGIVMLAFDLFLIYTNRKRNRIADNFKQTGRKVEAEITGVITDLNITVMDKHPYLINCRWTDPISGKEYSHSIDQIWKDPAPFLAGRRHIDVYIDRNNPDNYFLDIDFLKEIKAY